MANDDDLIDDDDDVIDSDDFDVVVDDEDVIDVTDYGACQRIDIHRAYAKTAGVTEQSRSYTEINSGKFTFGYRATGSGSRTAKYILQPDTVTVSGTTYRGIACTAEKIKIAQDSTDGGKFVAQVGSTFPATGYMRVITSVILERRTSGDFGARLGWSVEYLPFRNGICILKSR